MRDCLELTADIIEIHPVPVGTLAFSVPFNVRSSVISESSVKIGSAPFSLDALCDISTLPYLSLYNSHTHTHVIDMEEGASLKSQSKVSSAGTYYSVQVSASSMDDSHTLQSFVDSLSSAGCFDVVIVDSSERIYIVRASAPSSSVSITSNIPLGNGHSLSFDVMSVNGLQYVLQEVQSPED